MDRDLCMAQFVGATVVTGPVVVGFVVQDVAYYFFLLHLDYVLVLS